MDFFGREDDIRELRRIRESAGKSARFTVVTGRRRVGKTEWLHKAFEDRPYPSKRNAPHSLHFVSLPDM